MATFSFASLDDADRESLLRQVLPAVRGAVSSQTPKLLRADVSPRTVEFHLTQIYRKLGIRSRTQLVASEAVPREP